MESAEGNQHPSQLPPGHPFARGVELFNNGDFFGAHEIWEELWRNSPEPSRSFYQGLIQIAVALHHLKRHNMVGFRRLVSQGTQKLTPYLPEYEGVHVLEFLSRLAKLTEQVEREFRDHRELSAGIATIETNMSGIQIALIHPVN